MKNSYVHVGQFLRENSNQLAGEIKDVHLDNYPELAKSYTKESHERYLADAQHFLEVLGNAVLNDRQALLNQYLVWLAKLFHSLKFPIDAMERFIEHTMYCFRGRLKVEDYQLVETVVNEGMAVYRNQFFESSRTATIHHDEAHAFLDLILDANPEHIKNWVNGQITDMASVKNLYTNIIEPSLFQLGQLVELNTISIAKSHYCFGLIQQVISGVYPMILKLKKPVNKRMLSYCIKGEPHEIGLMMVTDFFEMAGWETTYFGGATPFEVVLDTVRTDLPDLLVISATLPEHVEFVRQFIDELKRESKGVKVLVGGHAFNQNKGLWKVVGADAYARNAELSVMMAENVMKVEGRE